METTTSIDVYLETGQKRVFAGALQWLGWCRSGRDEESALQTLLEYGPRYAHVLDGTSLVFEASAEISAFQVVERLKGNMTTDFGTPDRWPSADSVPFGEEELQRAKLQLAALLAGVYPARKIGEMAAAKALRGE